MDTDARSGSNRLGAFIAIGAGLGATVGVLVAGGPGVAIGIAIGAGLGVVAGAATGGPRRVPPRP